MAGRCYIRTSVFLLQSSAVGLLSGGSACGRALAVSAPVFALELSQCPHALTSWINSWESAMADEELLWGTTEEVGEALEELKLNHPGWSDRVFLLYTLAQYRDLDYARRRGQCAGLSEMCTPACVAVLCQAARQIDIPVDVQGIQIIAVRPEGDYDTIDVKIIGERSANGVGPGDVIEYLRLARYRYEQSTEGETGVSETCGRCGGAIDPTSDWKCRFCDQLINAQSTGWMIEKIMNQGDYVA